MAESVPLRTFAVFAGGCCAAGVACFAPDMTTTPPVATATARTAAPASTQVFRSSARDPDSPVDRELLNLRPAAAGHPPRPPTDGFCDLQASIADCSCGEFDRRRSRALRCPRTSGRGSPARRGRGCTGPSSTTPAVGRGRAAGRWSSTATAGPCRPEGPLERSRVRVNSGGPVPVAPAGGLHRVGEVRDAVAAYALGVGHSFGERRRPRRS